MLVGHGVIGPHRSAGTVAQVDNRADVVRAYLGSFATGDPEAVAASVTVDFVNEHLSELGAGCEGREEYRRRLADFLSTFAGARYSIVTLAEVATPDAGDVVVRYRFEATYEGMPIDIPGVMWFEVRDGLIARRTDLWDSLTFLRQVGQAD
jgi:ketosteroid isomerase-like protein